MCKALVNDIGKTVSRALDVSNLIGAGDSPTIVLPEIQQQQEAATGASSSSALNTARRRARGGRRTGFAQLLLSRDRGQASVIRKQLIGG